VALSVGTQLDLNPSQGCHEIGFLHIDQIVEIKKGA
jgi:hypothetical protein